MTFIPTPRDLTLAEVLEELERQGAHDLTSVTFATPFGPVVNLDDQYDIRWEAGAPVVHLGSTDDLG